MNKGWKIFLWIIVILLVVVGTVIGLGGWYAYNLFTNSGGQLPEVNAFIRDIDGDVTYSRGGGNFVATNYMALEEGDVVMTGENSGASIYWSGYGRTVLEENTEVVVSAADRSGKDGIRARLRVDFGRTWTRIEKLLGTGSDVTVQASDVVATVRGTSFGVDNLGPDVQVRVAESNVSVGTGVGDLASDNFAFSEALSLGEGKKVLNQNDRFGSVNDLTASDLQDPLLIEGNRPIPEEDLIGCSELSVPEFWTWLVKSIQYIQANPSILDTAAGQESFIEWLPNRYRLCARTILNS